MTYIERTSTICVVRPPIKAGLAVLPKAEPEYFSRYYNTVEATDDHARILVTPEREVKTTWPLQ